MADKRQGRRNDYILYRQFINYEQHSLIIYLWPSFASLVGLKVINSWVAVKVVTYFKVILSLDILLDSHHTGL